MEVDKKNIAFVVFVVVVGILFILLIYSISSKKDDKFEDLDTKEEEPVVENELLDNADVQTLFEIFSKLDTDQDSLYINKNKHTKDSDLSNEEKLFVVVKTISYNDYINVNCGELSNSIVIPPGFVCNSKSYGIHRGKIGARYDELFGFDKELEYDNFLSYIYDPELYMYIYFDLNNDFEDDYDMPRAKLKDAYIEDGKVKIKYGLDYSGSGSGYFKEDVILTFKPYNDRYVFVSKQVIID